MTEPLSRDDVIELLNKLGGEQDAEVLEAARAVHARIAAAGTTWEQLLVPEGGIDEADDIDEADEYDDDDDAEAGDDADDDEADTDDDGAEADDDADDDTDDDDARAEADEIDDGDSPDPEDAAAQSANGAGAKSAAKHADSIALIDKLLAKSSISAGLREELEGYKTDIAEGEFEARDRRYIRAIHKRLSKRR